MKRELHRPDCASEELDPSKVVDVGAAVVIRSDGNFLLAQRPQGKVYAGYWEFPGGKIEPGESAQEGLIRELHEELGIDVQTAYPWLTHVFTYPHATVRLHFFRVTRWGGEPHGRENQHIAWTRPDEPPLQPMLPANTPIFRALRLPAVYAITNAQELGVRLQEGIPVGRRENLEFGDRDATSRWRHVGTRRIERGGGGERLLPRHAENPVHEQACRLRMRRA